MPDTRITRSLIRRIESDRESSLTKLEAIQELRQHLDRVEEDALAEARDAGVSISEIAETMRVTRQSVYNRLKQIAQKAQRGETIIVPELEPRPKE